MRTYIDNRRSEVTGDWPAPTAALPMNLTLVGTSRCDVTAREAAGGIVAPLNAARTAQRAVPTRFRGSMREIFRGNLSPRRGRIVRYLTRGSATEETTTLLEQTRASDDCSLSLGERAGVRAKVITDSLERRRLGWQP